MAGGVQEILDQEHERLVERVCAVDVAKASGMVCLRVPRPAGGRSSRVWQVPATSRAVADLAAQLVDAGVEKVTVESTSDYWRIWFYLLEAVGLDVQLVNAREVKNVPGRPKTDLLTEPLHVTAGQELVVGEGRALDPRLGVRRALDMAVSTVPPDLVADIRGHSSPLASPPGALRSSSRAARGGAIGR